MRFYGLNCVKEESMSYIRMSTLNEDGNFGRMILYLWGNSFECVFPCLHSHHRKTKDCVNWAI